MESSPKRVPFRLRQGHHWEDRHCWDLGATGNPSEQRPLFAGTWAPVTFHQRVLASFWDNARPRVRGTSNKKSVGVGGKTKKGGFSEDGAGI